MGEPTSPLELLWFISLFLCLFSSSLVYSRNLESTSHASTHHHESKSNNSFPAFKLYPLSSLSPSSFKSYREKALSVLKSDSDRVKFIYRKLNLSLGENALYNLGEMDLQAQAPVTSMGGGYYVKIGIGTPSTEVYLQMDTGSDITWVKCEPCPSCEGQKFDPSSSTSYKPLTCDSPKCKVDDDASCSVDGETCEFGIRYGDMSETVGKLVSESLTFDDMNSIEDVAVGCSQATSEGFTYGSGILGLGHGSLSFPSQVPSASSFSYCMASSETSSSPASTLEFGSSSAPPAKAVTVPFQTEEGHYYVDLTGISVGEQMLGGSRGGIVVDSGTTLTYLPEELYNIFQEAFLSGTNATAVPSDITDGLVCYESMIEAPEIAFHFEEKVLVIPNNNHFWKVADNLFCFAYAPVDGADAIIGYTLQQGMRVNYDLPTSSLSFSPNQC